MRTYRPVMVMCVLIGLFTFGACGYILGPLLNLDPTEGMLEGTKKSDARDLAWAKQYGDTATIRDTCRDPPKVQFEHYNEWTNKEIGDEACAYVKRDFDSKVAQAEQVASTVGGGPCLLAVHEIFEKEDHGKHTLPWETEEGRREVLSAVAEPCIVEIEAQASEGRHTSVYASLVEYRELLSTPALTSAQHQRLSELWSASTVAARGSYEFESTNMALDDDFLGAAFYLASAASVARVTGDTEGATALTEEAKGLLEQSGVSDRLIATVSGSGLGADVVKEVTRMGAGPRVGFGKEGKTRVILKLNLKSPDIRTGTKNVTLSGAYDKPNGTKRNPDYTAHEEKCAAHRRKGEEQIRECGDDFNCKGTAFFAAENCESLQSRIQRDIQLYETITADYSAVHEFGAATGTLTITEGKDTPTRATIEASVSRHEHGEVPSIMVSASSARKVTQSEMKDEYIHSAAYHVRALLEQRGSEFTNALLETAREAQSADAAAVGFTHYTLVAKELPSSDVLNPFVKEHGLPVRQALIVLFDFDARL